MWGGRFAAAPSDVMSRINASIGFDKRLWREDLAASRAHAEMLVRQDIVDEGDGAAILDGLDRIAAEYEAGGVAEDAALEDMKEGARSLGADGIVGIDFDYEVLGENNGMMMVSVSGTAVKMA